MLTLGDTESQTVFQEPLLFLIYPLAQISNYPCINVQELLARPVDKLLDQLGLQGWRDRIRFNCLAVK